MGVVEAEALLSPEERQAIYEEQRARALSEGEATGWVVPGDDPYRGEWQMNFDWPATAGVGVGSGEDAEWVQDSLDAPVVEATLVVGQRYKKGDRAGQLRTSTTRRAKFSGSDYKQMRESVAPGWNRLKEDHWGVPDPFAYGVSQGQGGGGVLGQYLPLWPGPVTRQLYWQDYWMMSAKSFEAYNHDPISWRMIHLKSEFALGKGIQIKVTRSRGSQKGQAHDQAAERFQEFWGRNKMDARLDTIARDYCWGGEQFLRYFKKGTKLSVRALDPATIYDLITDPEDIETVFAYHQQFQTAYQLYPPKGGRPAGLDPAPTGTSQPGASVRYIIRQILPQEIDHYKANSSSAERRGRSDLFPALGWIKRLRDYLTSHVIQADMLSRICWDLEVAGNAGAIRAMRELLFPGGQAPPPGTIFGHNSSSKLTALAPEQSGGATGSRGDPVLDALATMVSLSGGVPKDWLGFGLQNTRAGALVAVAPASKALDALQKFLEGLVHDCFERVMRTALITDAELEVIFPSITEDSRKEKLDDLGTMEANGWLAKRTSGTIAAKEMGITTYDFDTEQELIAGEFPKAEHETKTDPVLLGPDGKPLKTKTPKQGDGVIRRPMLIATKRQAPKLDVTLSTSVEDEPQGLAIPLSGSGGDPGLPAPGSADGTGRTVPGGGNHKDSPSPMAPSGARDIKKEGTNLREDDEMIVLPARALNLLLMRERLGARRRPDDPEFEAEARRFQEESATNLRELVDSVTGV